MSNALKLAFQMANLVEYRTRNQEYRGSVEEGTWFLQGAMAEIKYL